MAEWLKAPHSKRGRGESPSEVQILSPPQVVIFGRLAQLVERSLDVRKVTGSNPVLPTKRF